MQFEVVIAAAMQAATITTNLNQFFGNLMLLGAGIVGGWGGVHILMGGFQIAGAHGNVQKVELWEEFPGPVGVDAGGPNGGYFQSCAMNTPGSGSPCDVFRTRR